MFSAKEICHYFIKVEREKISMLKKIVISLVLFAIVIATAMYFMNKTESSAKESIEEIELSEEEARAIEILNEEMIQDQCVVYADEDNVKDEELKAYLSSCVEQLKAEATMIEPADEDSPKTKEEIRKQCAVYAKEDKVEKEKLEDYMDLCIEQLETEVVVIDPENKETTEKVVREEKQIKENTEVVNKETTKQVVTEEEQIKDNTKVVNKKSDDRKPSETLK